MAIATDTFTRTVSGGWGTADSGGAWTVTNGTYFTVNGSQGVISAHAGSTTYARLGSVSSTSTDVYATVSPAAIPVSGNLYMYVHSRSISDSSSGTTSYGAIVQVTAPGAVSAIIRVNGTGVLSSGTLFTASGGDTFNVRVRTTGTSPTTISAKVWKSGTSEPSAWSVSTTDSTSGLQTSGAVSVGSYMSSTVTNGPVNLSWDALTVSDVSQAPSVSAGANSTGTVGVSATLNGTATAAAGATISSTTWSCTAYPGGTAPTITGGTTLTPSFTPGTGGTYTFQLTATDSNTNTASASTQVVVSASSPPTAAATVTSNIARIDATGSTPSVNGDTLSYAISPTTGTSQPAAGVFLAPMGTTAVTYTVTVTEVGNGTSSTVTVSVPAVSTSAAVVATSKVRVAGAWT